MTRRILAIIVAVVLAGLGTIGVLFYALNADQRAHDRLTAATRVAIVVKRIPVGTTGARILSENMISYDNLPNSALPADRSVLVSTFDDDLRKLAVTSTVQPGQVLLKSMFAQQSTVASGLSLPDGKMAVSVELSVPEQVAGYVQSGSEIALFLTYDAVDRDGRQTGLTRTRILLPRTEVVAVGTYTPPTDETTTTGSAGRTGSLLVTVAVTQGEAERLVEAVRTGKLYIGLLTDSINVRPGAGVDNADSGGGITPLFP